MRLEGARRRAGHQRVEHRRLHLEEAAVVEEAPDVADELGALAEVLAHLRIGGEVEVALAVARLDVVEAVPLLGQRAQRLGEEGPLVGDDGELAGLGADRPAAGRRPVAEVEELEQLVGVAEAILAELHLDVARPVAQDDEGHLPEGPDHHHPAGDRPDGLVLLDLLGGLVAEARLDPGGGVGDLPAVAPRVDAQLAQLLGLLQAQGALRLQRRGSGRRFLLLRHRLLLDPQPSFPKDDGGLRNPAHTTFRQVENQGAKRPSGRPAARFTAGERRGWIGERGPHGSAPAPHAEMGRSTQT